MRTEYTKMVTKNEKEKKWKKNLKQHASECVALAGVLVKQVLRQSNHWTLKFFTYNIFYG